MFKFLVVVALLVLSGCSYTEHRVDDFYRPGKQHLKVWRQDTKEEQYNPVVETLTTPILVTAGAGYVAGITLYEAGGLIYAPIYGLGVGLDHASQGD